MKDIGLYKEVHKCNLFTAYNPNLKPSILSELESRNIEMPNNREIVRSYFLHMISEEIFKQDGNPLPALTNPGKSVETVESPKKDDKNKSQEESVQMKDKSITKIRSSLILQSIANFDEESSKETSFQSSASKMEAKKKSV